LADEKWRKTKVCHPGASALTWPFFFIFFFFSSFLVCYGATVVEHFLRAKVFFWGGLPECVVIIMRKEQKRCKNKKKLKHQRWHKKQVFWIAFFILISQQRNFNKISQILATRFWH
jgi:hypothetical protein